MDDPQKSKNKTKLKHPNEEEINNQNSGNPIIIIHQSLYPINLFELNIDKNYTLNKIIMIREHMIPSRCLSSLPFTILTRSMYSMRQARSLFLYITAVKKRLKKKDLKWVFNLQNVRWECELWLIWNTEGLRLYLVIKRKKFSQKQSIKHMACSYVITH